MELHQEGIGEDLRGGEWSHGRVDLFRRDRRDGQQHQRDIQDDSTMWRPFTASSHATSTHSHGHPKKQPHGHTNTRTHTLVPVRSPFVFSALQQTIINLNIYNVWCMMYDKKYMCIFYVIKGTVIGMLVGHKHICQNGCSNMFSLHGDSYWIFWVFSVSLRYLRKTDRYFARVCARGWLEGGEETGTWCVVWSRGSRALPPSTPEQLGRGARGSERKPRRNISNRGGSGGRAKAARESRKLSCWIFGWRRWNASRRRNW